MEISPRYAPDPIITLEGDPAAIVEPMIRQRRRLADALATLSDEQWDQHSRCEGWTNRDVIVHLGSTNNFWEYSLRAGQRGEPTRFLAEFDPVNSPAELVAGSRDLPVRDVLDQFVSSSDSLAGVVASLDDPAALAEAPPGHLTTDAVLHHALWDSWVHERDVLLPLGMSVDIEPDEVAAAIRYVAALAPALAVDRDDARVGTLAISTTRPDLSIVVEIGERVVVRDGTADAELLLTGDAVDLLEALSVRAPLDQSIPVDQRWMVEGLAEVFEVEPS